MIGPESASGSTIAVASDWLPCVPTYVYCVRILYMIIKHNATH
jgi:hypothetical protein